MNEKDITRASVENNPGSKMYDLQKYFKYINDILEKYAWENKRKKQIQESLNSIVSRYNDPNFYLCVIGEFSSGKSTLINALLREDILSTSTIQATTCAPTLIKAGDSKKITVYLQDGKKLSYPGMKKKWESMGITWDTGENAYYRILEQVTSIEDVASSIQYVQFEHDAELLKKGLVILDTPGANALNQRHGEAASWALKEIADAAIVLTSAEQPVSSYLSDFLLKHIPDELHRCLFVITKLDLIKDRAQRKALHDTVRARIKSSLELSSPQVLPVTTVFIQSQYSQEEDYFLQRLNDDAKEDLHELFDKFEAKIFEVLEKQRYFVLFDRLANMLHQLLVEVKTDLEKMEKDLEEERKGLQENRLMNLKEYIDDKDYEVRKEFRMEVKGVNDAIRKGIKKIEKKISKNLKEVIDDAFSLEDIDEELEDELDDVLEESNKKLKSLVNKNTKRVQTEYNEAKKSFEKLFFKQYEQLATLGGTLTSKVTLPRTDVVLSMKELDVGLHGVRNILEEKNSEKKGRGRAGATIGAGIGLVLGGPFGAVAGGALGRWIGRNSGEDDKEVKRALKVEINSKINNSFSSVSYDFNKEIKQTVSKAEKTLSRMVKDYYNMYNDLANTMEQRNKEHEAQLKERKQMVNKDLKKLYTHQTELTTLKIELREKSAL